MTILEAVILGVIQGIFMFFPVSSTSHLALAQHALLSRGSNMPSPDSPEMILFDLAVHVGTLVSIAWVFAPLLRTYLVHLTREVRTLSLGRLHRDPWPLHVRLTCLGVLTVGVTGIFGLLLRSPFERVFANPVAIALCLTVTGCLLYFSDHLRPTRIGLRQMGVKQATWIGIAQALALAPGLSRSGLTIVFALMLGVKRRWAARYSFLIAIPTILAIATVQLILVLRQSPPDSVAWIPMLVGAAVAAVVGVIALKIVLKLLLRAHFRIFAWYVWVLAGVVLWFHLA